MRNVARSAATTIIATRRLRRARCRGSVGCQATGVLLRSVEIPARPYLPALTPAASSAEVEPWSREVEPWSREVEPWSGRRPVRSGPRRRWSRCSGLRRRHPGLSAGGSRSAALTPLRIRAHPHRSAIVSHGDVGRRSRPSGCPPEQRARAGSARGRPERPGGSSRLCGFVPRARRARTTCST